jgi:hypothetical protein
MEYRKLQRKDTIIDEGENAKERNDRKESSIDWNARGFGAKSRK